MPNPQHAMENTFYFFYSLLKFVDPSLAPASVVKPNPYEPILPNTYSFLADFYLDLAVVGGENIVALCDVYDPAVL